MIVFIFRLSVVVISLLKPSVHFVHWGVVVTGSIVDKPGRGPGPVNLRFFATGLSLRKLHVFEAMGFPLVRFDVRTPVGLAELTRRGRKEVIRADNLPMFIGAGSRDLGNAFFVERRYDLNQFFIIDKKADIRVSAEFPIGDGYGTPRCAALVDRSISFETKN